MITVRTNIIPVISVDAHGHYQMYHFHEGGKLFHILDVGLMKISSLNHSLQGLICFLISAISC